MTVFTLSSPDIPSGGTVPPHFEFDGFGCSLMATQIPPPMATSNSPT